MNKILNRALGIITFGISVFIFLKVGEIIEEGIIGTLTLILALPLFVFSIILFFSPEIKEFEKTKNSETGGKNGTWLNN